MLRKIAVISILGLVLAVIGCESSGDSTASSVPAGYSPSKRGGRHNASQFLSADGGGGGGGGYVSDSPDQTPVDAMGEQPRQQIRGATLAVRVSKLEDAEKKVQTAIKESGGYEQSLNSSDLAGADAMLTISAKVPVQKLDDVIAQIEGLGTRTAKTVSMQDVTETMISYDSQLKALRDQRANLKKAGATNVDYPTFQSEDQTLQSQINQLQQQRDAQAAVVQYSDLQLTLRQGAVPGQRDPNWLAESYGNASASAGDAFRVTATGFLWIVFMSPFYVPFLAGGWLAYRLYKRKATPPAPSMPRTVPPVAPNPAQ